MELYESCACTANAKDDYLNIEDKRRLRVMQTTNRHLQEQLVYWQAQLAPLAVPPPSDAVETFVRGFVPLNEIEEEDILYFTSNLVNDSEFFESLRREIRCCATGELVENITGNQNTKAIFTILPPQGTLTDEGSLDIVREVSFISPDGVVWRAEGLHRERHGVEGTIFRLYDNLSKMKLLLKKRYSV